MDIKKWLISWFEKNSGLEPGEIEKNTDVNYFEKGWIDSFKFISFINDIENEFKIKFSNEEFQNRNFSTINGLADIIRGKIHGRF